MALVVLALRGGPEAEEWRGFPEELERIVHKGYLINYSHYCIDIVKRCQMGRERSRLATAVDNATSHTFFPNCQSNHTSAEIDLSGALNVFICGSGPDIEVDGCEEALDRLHAIYKVGQQ